MFKNLKWDKYMIILVLLLVFTFGVRYYYFTQHQDQALWYDEGEYLLRAKTFVFDHMSEAPGVSERRPVLMPAFWSGFLAFGMGEMAIKFFQILISVAGVFLIYLLGKELHGKKLGLIMASLLSFYWMHIFFSFRILLDEWALAASILAVYFFVRWYKNKNLWDAVGFGFATALAVMIFYIPLYLVALFGTFLLITKRLDFLKEKTFWYAVLALFVTALPWLIWCYIQYGNPFFGFTSYHGTWAKMDGYDYGLWGFMKVLPYGLIGPMFYFFLFGLGKSLLDMVMSADLILKRTVKKFDMDLLMLIWLIGVTVALAVEIKHVEPRYMFPAFVPAFYFLGKGLLFIYDVVKSSVSKLENANFKYLALLVIILIISYFGYIQLTFADNLIENKAKGFSQERVAGDWLEANMAIDEVFLTCNNIPLYEAYSDRLGYNFGRNLSRLDYFIGEKHPKYLVAGAYSPDCAFEYIQNNATVFKLANVLFEDVARTQPVVGIYLIDYFYYE